MKNIIMLLFIVFIVGCNNNSKILREISLLQQRSIILPKQSEVIFDISKIGIDDTKKALKYVIYNDSMSCSSCAVNRMCLWNVFIEYAQIYNGRLKYYFIYSPAKKDYKMLKNLLLNDDFNYPVLLDTLGEFEKLNPHLPKNGALHTFLLDENNNVILVGSPLHNKKIEEMFYKIVKEKLGNSQ